MLEFLLFTPPQNLSSTIFIGVIGLLIGSFLNVVIHRLPKMMEKESDNYVIEILTSWVNNDVVIRLGNQEFIVFQKKRTPDYIESGKELPNKDKYNLMVPRSACPQCGHEITAAENIPVLSYLVLRGKCRGCKTPISIRYPTVELLTACTSALMIWHFGSGVAGLAAVVLTWFLIAMTFIDADTQLLPDDLTLPLLWGGLFVNMFATFTTLENAVIGAAAGYLALWSVYWLFKLVTGKEGMGYGDFKLLAALGAWMGWNMLPMIILLSSLVGAIVGITLIVTGKMNKSKPIPFGPYLAAAGFIALIWGRTITNQYIDFIS